MERINALYNDRWTLLNLFQEGLRKNPTLSAVRFDDGYQIVEMNYLRLNEESNAVANKLNDFHLENEMIGLSAHMNGSVISVMLGILKIPAAFAFINFKSSLHNNLLFIKALGARFVLIEQNESKVTRDLGNVNKICEIQCKFATMILLEVNEIKRKKYNFGDWNLAYAIQTSGTTGSRKTVKVPHRCIVPNIIHLKEVYKVKPNDVIYFTAPFVFDPSIVGVFIALLCGACVLLMPDIFKHMTYKFIRLLIDRGKTTIMQCTPSFMKNFCPELLRKTILSATSSLRILELGGEPCPSRSCLYSWKDSHNRTQFYNVYGLTEVSCWATIHFINFDNIDDENKEDVPLGKALLGTVIQVIGRNKQVLESGDGELFTGGTDRICFIDNEDYSSQISLRSTGDIVKIQPDGNLYFVSRIDDQIKRNGVKIFLGQIEKVARLIPGVEECFSLFQKEKQHIILVVRITDFKTQIHDVSEKDLRDHLKQNLPSYSQPDVVMFCDSIPLTSNGKLDKHEIFHLAYSKNGPDTGTNTSKKIDNKMFYLWKIHLGSNLQVSANDNFMLCGGDSFQVLHITSEIELWLKIKCPQLAEKLLREGFQAVCSYLSDLINEVPVCYDVNHASSSYVNNPSHDELSSCDVSEHLITSRGHTLRMLTLTDIRCQNDIPNIKADIVWEYNTKKCVDASPLIINTPEGKIVLIGSHSHTFYAIWLKNGHTKWEFNANDRIESSACASTCGQKVFVGSYDGFLYCLDIVQGKELWKFYSDGIIKCSPVFDYLNNYVYFGAYDHHVYAIYANSGNCVWKIKPGAGSIFSSPCLSLSPHQLYICTLDGHLFALKPNSGNILWKFNFPSPVFSSCTLFQGGLCTGCVDNNFYAFDHCGSLMWIFSTNGPIFSSPCAALLTSNLKSSPFIVFGSHDHYVYCVNALTGCLQWKSRLNSPVYSSPFIHCLNVKGGNNDWVEKNVVYTCTTAGTLYILCLNCGRIYSEYKFSKQIFSSPVAVENYIVVGCRDNNVNCLIVTA